MKRIAVIVISIALLYISCAAMSQTTLSTLGMQTQETGLGDLATDALRASTGAQISFIPAGSFKEASVPADRIKYADVNSFLQYSDDSINVMDLTGAQIVKALERSVSLYPQKNMGFLQVSGLTFSFNPKAPRGSRISSVTLDDKTKINPNSRYRVATTHPFANGEYGYFIIWGKDKDKITDSGVSISAAVSNYIAKTDLPDYSVPGRITQIK
jgi:2',3'-cyclic-nucleotide 2'-phosphodiesterase (5'-nucleotidase family)